MFSSFFVTFKYFLFSHANFWTVVSSVDILPFYLALLGPVPQSVTCLTADPGVASLVPAWSHTFAEIDHEIISTAILFPSADWKSVDVSHKLKVCGQITGYPLSQAYPGKNVVRWTDCPDMIIAVDWDVKNQIKQINKSSDYLWFSISKEFKQNAIKHSRSQFKLNSNLHWKKFVQREIRQE